MVITAPSANTPSQNDELPRKRNRSLLKAFFLKGWGDKRTTAYNTGKQLYRLRYMDQQGYSDKKCKIFANRYAELSALNIEPRHAEIRAHIDISRIYGSSF